MQADISAALKKICIIGVEPLVEQKLEKILKDRAIARAQAAYERELVKARVDELEPLSLLKTLQGIVLPKQGKRGPKPRSTAGEVTSPASDMLGLASADPDETSAGEEGVSGE
jgi:hypothetical protein